MGKIRSKTNFLALERDWFIASIIPLKDFSVNLKTHLWNTLSGQSIKICYNINKLAELPFLKKFHFPSLSFKAFSGRPSRVVGIDIGISSSKVVQLKYENERAVLETYGELLNGQYFKGTEGLGGGFLRYLDNDVAALLKDVMKESNIVTKDAVVAIPATSSFVTTLSFPVIPRKEIEEAIPYEARKYIPISISEVVLDWEIFDQQNNEDKVEVLLVAVPREMIEKLKRIATLANINLKALEVETFSLVRSLVVNDSTPTAIINLGSQSTTICMVDKGKLKVSHNLSRGSQELTNALQRGMGIDKDRAESIKKDTGLSDKPEEKEITSISSPLVDVLFAEIERMISMQNRKTSRKIQKINLTGGGSNLKGIVDYASIKLGLEVTKGNPFSRLVTPAFLQPVLRELAPSFSVAVGLALHEISSS